ncbi:MAG: hypothetical protein HUJ56_03220 [Erysipelotrichaceae bacterium]|nr:hypothetical protein [Erysipelotrichaceae bacterium]
MSRNWDTLTTLGKFFSVLDDNTYKYDLLLKLGKTFIGNDAMKRAENARKSVDSWSKAGRDLRDAKYLKVLIDCEYAPLFELIEEERLVEVLGKCLESDSQDLDYLKAMMIDHMNTDFGVVNHDIQLDDGVDVSSFLEKSVEHRKDVKGVYIATRSGWNWVLEGHPYREWLNKFITKKIPVKVLTNPKGVVENKLTESDPEMIRDFDQALIDWNNFAHQWIVIGNKKVKKRAYVEHRVCEVSIQQKVILVEYLNGDFCGIVRNYGYKLPKDVEGLWTFLPNGDARLLQAIEEYGYLFEHSLPYKTFRDEKDFESGCEIGIDDFFDHVRLRVSEIEEVGMMFATGWNWEEDSVLTKCMELFLECGTELKIISNPDSALEHVQDLHHGKNRSDYRGYDAAVGYWKGKCTRFMGKLAYRVCEVPILRRFYYIKYKNGLEEGLVCNYIYGEEAGGRPYYYLEGNSRELLRYKREFDNLFVMSIDPAIWTKGDRV